ncbi:hypothetical protein MKW92_051150 [Papaver armeniacum]|nr:hypothetical protein MKW92_051150 [Papaver armeniacum]
MSIASYNLRNRIETDNPAYVIYQGVEKPDDDDISYKDDNIHHPIIDQAPYIILIQGPPSVGKSLLVKSLVKYFTKTHATDVLGPITVASGLCNIRRLQFVECPDDINGMIDAAKYADVALLLIDASYGFQMETFEFLNLLRVHSFPKVLGVFTHLDGFKDETKLKETKERFQNNFWTEIAEGAKLFYLSGLEDELYKMSEIQQLAEVMSTFEFLPSSWRAAHPYVLVDRFEDVTPLERVQKDSECDRNIHLYGYLRGGNIINGAKVHIAGVGDFRIAGVTISIDPFPLSTEIEGENDLAELPCLEIEAFRTGDYVRLEVLDVPFGMVGKFDPCHPILVGGISLEEENVGYMQVKLKRHRWHMKLLNTGDQIIVSAGWRRYVTTPIYAMENSKNGQHRILTYTPEHKHCLAMFWGPHSPPHTRVAVVQSVPDNKEEFRITAKGVVLDFNHASKIVKKTTRKGTPRKIFKNTAFIQFTSDVGTGRLRGAPIRTMSGIRGKVDEAVNGEGIVRCTFRRKIRKSDVVFFQVLTPVDVPYLIHQFTATMGSHDFIVPVKTNPRKMDDRAQRGEIHKQRRRVLIKEGGPFFLSCSNPLELIYSHERQMKRKDTHESKEEEERKRKKMLKKIKKGKVFESKPLALNSDSSYELCYM